MRCSSSSTLLSAPGHTASADSACASATSRFTGRAPRCGSVCVGSAAHSSHTSAGTFGLGRSSLPSITAFFSPPGMDSRSPVRNRTTFTAVVRSKNGRMQSTAFSRSSPGMRRASGLRTMRPSS